MNRSQLLLRSLIQFRWLNLALILAVAVATAVLTGALIVGDSVRGSLRELIAERLGPIDLLLLNDRFFDPSLAAQIESESTQRSIQTACILPQLTIEVQNEGRRSRGVFLSAWQNDEFGIERDEIVINTALADELDVQVGDQLVIRLPEINEVPADSALGRKDAGVQSRAGLRIKQIVPMSGWGRLSLSRNQRTVRNAFVAMPTLQRALGIGDRVNAIVVTEPDASRHDALATELDSLLKPALADYGVTLERVTGAYGAGEAAWSAWQFTSDRMLWDEAMRRAVLKSTERLAPRENLTYLANSIHLAGVAENEIPYSTITALDPAALEAFETTSGEPISDLSTDEIVLNEWAAADLGAEIGDELAVAYFAPETTHGEVIERWKSFTLRGVVSLTKPTAPFRRNRPAQFDKPPTRANDPALTPSVPGVTDQASIDDWDPPFPFDQRRVRPADDEYWDDYRTTPKAFVSLEAGRSMWASRFGQTTGIRVADSDAVDQAQLTFDAEAALHAENENLGFTFRKVKQESLQSASGTTPFEALFLGFGFFLIASALMLIAILIRLGVQTRARELGLLQATGWSARAVTRQLLMETLIVAAIGVAIGIDLGIFSASGILAALRTLWVRAISTPFVQLHVVLNTIVIGGLVSLAMAALVAWWTIRGMTRVEPTMLLRGRAEPTDTLFSARKWPQRIAVALVTVAVATACFGMRADGMAQAGAFFGAGALVLVALLLLVRFRVFQRAAQSSRQIQSLPGLAALGAARNPGRSALTVGLVAAATFLIIAIAAFRLEPTDSGTGGFDLIAYSDRPIFDNLNDRNRRSRELPALGDANVSMVAMRVKPGDDASCRNLFRVSQPQLLGVTPQFISRFESGSTPFAWAGFAAKEDGTKPSNPWELLRQPTKPGEPIPVILDKNTAMYSLHLKGRVGEEFTIRYDEPMRFRTVALVFNTILQGNLLVGEADFERLFPSVAGYRMLLVDAEADALDTAKKALERRYSDEGLDVENAGVLLEDLLAVQNTYLSTFQSLGALGLILGTFGLALVQLRSVVERQGEIALLQSIGFSPLSVGRIVRLETLYLLLLGLAVGVVSAIVAVAPHFIDGRANLPVFALVLTLLAIVFCGLAASAVAVRAAQRVPVLQTLRREL